MVVKPAVTNRPPITVTESQTVSASEREVIAIHYVNSTAGVGLVRVWNGNANETVWLGSNANGGNDSFTPAQNMKFSKVVVDFVTGTGYVTLLMN